LADLPGVALVGDSICIGYAPRVAELLSGRAQVVAPARSGEDSRRVLPLLEGALRRGPTLVHLNCGLHDLRRMRSTARCQVPLDRYAANLRAMVDRVRDAGGSLVFATTTPVDDRRHALRGLAFDRFEADVQRYNAAAVRVMEGEGVPVDDLHAAVVAAGPERLLAEDGVHFTADGYAFLAEVVTGAVARALA
jgi:lysophospholipase L1-like esterase